MIGFNILNTKLKRKSSVGGARRRKVGGTSNWKLLKHEFLLGKVL